MLLPPMVILRERENERKYFQCALIIEKKMYRWNDSKLLVC